MTALFGWGDLGDQPIGCRPVGTARGALHEANNDECAQRQRQKVRKEQQRVSGHRGDHDRPRPESVGGPACGVANRRVGEQARRDSRTDERCRTALAA